MIAKRQHEMVRVAFWFNFARSIQLVLSTGVFTKLDDMFHFALQLFYEKVQPVQIAQVKWQL